MAGSDSYFIFGAQGTDYDTQCANIVKTIYEFTSLDLRDQRPVARLQRFKRNASPPDNIPGFRNAMGDIAFNLVADDMVAFFLHLLNDDSISSNDFTPQELYGDDALGVKAFGATPQSLDHQPTATATPCDPAKISVTLNVADSGALTITGTDQNDYPCVEVLTFGAEAGPLTTTKYFKTVNASGLTYTGLAVAVSWLITGDMNVWTHVISVGDTLLDGLTIEAVKSGIPYTYVGALINSASISIGEVINMTMNFMAKRGWPAHKINVANATPTASESGTDVSGYTAVSDDFFPEWGIALKLDASPTATPINDLTFNFSNNLAYIDGYNGSADRVKPRRSGLRDITIDVGIELTAALNIFDDLFENDDDIPVVVECFCKPLAGPELSLTITAGRCQIGASPDPGVSEFAQVIQPIQLRPVRSVGGATADELTITLQCTAAS